jgi:hypothetical protein
VRHYYIPPEEMKPVPITTYVIDPKKLPAHLSPPTRETES